MIITASEILRKEHRISIYRYPLNLVKRIEIIGMYHGELVEILEKNNTLRKYRNYLIHGTGQKDVLPQMIEFISNINFELHNELNIIYCITNISEGKVILWSKIKLFLSPAVQVLLVMRCCVDS